MNDKKQGQLILAAFLGFVYRGLDGNALPQISFFKHIKESVAHSFKKITSGRLD